MESKRLINALVALDLSAGIFLDRLRKLQPTDSDKVLLSIMDYFEFYLIFSLHKNASRFWRTKLWHSDYTLIIYWVWIFLVT